MKALPPRLGFLGVGWIGKNRLETIAKSELAEVAAICDASSEQAEKGLEIAPKAELADSFEHLLEMDLDGIVIATPSALHAAQAIRALEKGLPVFCQKPLGRNAKETHRVIEAARKADRLLGVDLSYRCMTCIQKTHEICRSGELGDIYAVDLVFHNAYGPDKPWFYERKLSGGGCVIDLGIHLVDLALWNLGFPGITQTCSRLFARGKILRDAGEQVEDYATAILDLENGTSVRLACSWKLPAGCNAIISGAFYGTKGGVGFHNLDGSFFDFVAERFHGTQRELLNGLREDWGGWMALNWTRQLASDPQFDCAVEEVGRVAGALDAIYQAA